jgi:hypothetical protein
VLSAPPQPSRLGSATECLCDTKHAIMCSALRDAEVLAGNFPVHVQHHVYSAREANSSRQVELWEFTRHMRRSLLTVPKMPSMLAGDTGTAVALCKCSAVSCQGAWEGFQTVVGERCRPIYSCTSSVVTCGLN